MTWINMGKIKTELNYREELIDAHIAAQTYPDSRRVKKKLLALQERWSKSLEMVFFVANNEGIPVTTEEVGHKCLSMPTERVSGHYQVGDVICHLPEHNCTTGVCWDRKGGEKPNMYAYHHDRVGRKIYLDKTNYLAADWYGTVMSTHDIKGDNNEVVKENNIDRFIRECDRAKAEGFSMLIVGVESTLEQFLAYRPNGEVGATRLSRLRRSESTIQKTGGFAHVMYCGSRQNAIDTLVSQNRMFAKYNYDKILNLETIT